jgi:hypothetical protein
MSLLDIFGVGENSHFVKKLHAKTYEKGMLVAFLELMQECNLSINIVGDTSNWNKTGKGTLLIGDHSNGLERFLIYTVCAQIQRDDLRFIGMPYAPIAAFAVQCDVCNVGYTLPVIPTAIAKDKKAKLNEFLFLRFMHRKQLPTIQECKIVNMQSLKSAGSFLQKGYVVNIFPTGNVFTDMQKPWRRGIGEILRYVSLDQRKNILLVPYAFDSSLSWLNMIRAVLSYNYGWKQKPKSINLHVGEEQTIADIIGEENDAKVITELVQLFYLSMMKV